MDFWHEEQRPCKVCGFHFTRHQMTMGVCYSCHFAQARQPRQAIETSRQLAKKYLAKHAKESNEDLLELLHTIGVITEEQKLTALLVVKKAYKELLDS